MTARRITVLSRAWCHLCHDMIAALEPLVHEYGLAVDVVEVDADPVLEAQWDELVPVLLIDGREICHYHLDELAVRAYFAAFPVESVD